MISWNKNLKTQRERTNLYVEDRPAVTFNDGAGADEAKSDLQKVVDFLKHPKKYHDASAPVLGKKLRELKLPQDVVFVSIHRGQRVLIPHGDTVLQAKDRVLAVTIPKNVPDLLKLLKGSVSHDQS